LIRHGARELGASAEPLQEEAFDQIETGGKGGGHEQDLEAEPEVCGLDPGDLREQIRQAGACVEGSGDSEEQRGGQEKTRSSPSPPSAARGPGHFSVLMNWSIVIAGSVMIWMVPRDPSATEIFAMVSLPGASTTFTKS